MKGARERDITNIYKGLFVPDTASVVVAIITLSVTAIKNTIASGRHILNGVWVCKMNLIIERSK